MIGFVIGGIVTYSFGFINEEDYLIGGIYLLIAMMIGFILYGYRLRVIKSGIELDDNVPSFELYENFMTGFDNFVVTLFYYIIPALIVLVVGYGTHLRDNAINVVWEFVSQIINCIIGNSTGFTLNTLSHAATNFLNSLFITITAALILFIIFSILKFAAEARLANTGSLKEALNIFGALKDIIRIGIVRVLILVLLVIVIIAVIGIIFITLFAYYPFLLTIIYSILTPYLILVTQRAIGLTYSDIAKI
ncbi:DUF4013 domain-containing protein [uncultured Methanobrevibacter sp.]|uniref:DUF4013 domain-containing protein n=1 Tax=uncultured Methanobrevibacter sp. TaxID=253161 RepID=UPI0025DD1409|nr:DUF4013 domain-containing protein [uncultured Methanobrevibacter sp.]